MVCGSVRGLVICFVVGVCVLGYGWCFLRFAVDGFAVLGFAGFAEIWRLYMELRLTVCGFTWGIL